MKKKAFLAILAIGLMGLGACHNQGNKGNEENFDIAGKTWTDGLYFFNVTKADSIFNCEGGSVHEGGIMFALVPTEEGFVGAKGNNGLAKNDSNYYEGYVFTGEEGDKFLPKVFNDKKMLIQYDKNNKAIAVYVETSDINQTMKADLLRYLFSGEYTKEDGTKVVFSVDKPEVTGLNAEATTFEPVTMYDLPSGTFKLGNDAFTLERTDDGATLQPVKQSKEDEEVWDDAGQPIVLKRVQGSEDQTGNVSKDVLTTSQLSYFTKGERKKMIDALKAKGDKASEIETINLQLLEAMAANEAD
ncbi:MAG: hypothetical protein IKX22_01180 [Prevotella sp.]|nr:hypothetical protein [Prevotella sp.]